MNAAEALVQMLVDTGVTHMFGLPGDTSMTFYDALYHRRDAIRHVMFRDERSASFAADAYARFTNRIGVTEGPSGGGATYIVPGVAEAQGSAVPMLCLTTDTPVSEEGRGVLTELDQVMLFTAVTKWTTKIKTSEGLPDALRRALRLATSGRPGATHLSLPADVLAGEIGDASTHTDPLWGSTPAAPVRPDPAAIERAARLIEGATRPVIVAGGGVHASRAWDALTRFAETLNLPVATSINGKGSIAETSPVSLGVVGGNGGREYTQRAVMEADLIFLIGTRTDSVTTLNWTLPAKPEQGGPAVIQLDMEPWEVGNNYRAAVPLVGDARLALQDLLAAIENPTAVGARNASRIASLGEDAAAWWERVRADGESTMRPIHPARLIRHLRAILPDDPLIVADPGTPTPYLAAQFEARVAGRGFAIPRAHGGLGYAIGGVVGAAMAARPGQRVVAMMGDGSFGMSCGDLETISRINAPVVVILCNNGSFGWIKELQHLYHDRRYYSVDFSTETDYGAIARAFGFKSARVADPNDLEGALQTAFADGGPYFLDVLTAPPMAETPPVAAWQAAVAAGAPGDD
ncbi:MAG: thiamine pyrophosphate-binding protein [Thermomicrobiales bacterium]